MILKRKKLKLLTKKHHESYENAKICCICEGKFKNKYLNEKRFFRVWDHWHHAGQYRGAAHGICNSKYSVPEKSLIVFHYGSYYDYHFSISKLAEKFKKQFTHLEGNT